MPAHSRSKNGVAELVIGPATSGRTRWLTQVAGIDAFWKSWPGSSLAFVAPPGRHEKRGEGNERQHFHRPCPARHRCDNADQDRGEAEPQGKAAWPDRLDREQDKRQRKPHP